MTKNSGAAGISRPDFRETGGVLVGRRQGGVVIARLRFKHTGEPHSVTFDWNLILNQEETYGNVVGFFHTHPEGIFSPSGRDDRTMQAWVSCFGKELACLIQCEDQIQGWEYSKTGKRKLPQPPHFKNSWIRIEL